MTVGDRGKRRAARGRVSASQQQTLSGRAVSRHTAAGCRAWSRISACSAQSTAERGTGSRDQSKQRDKPLDGSRSEAPSLDNEHINTATRRSPVET